MRSSRGSEEAKDHGVTIIEAVLFGSISVMVIMGVLPYLNKFASLQRVISAGDVQGTMARAGNAIEVDLLEASPSTLDFTTLYPNTTNLSAIAFNKVDYSFSQSTSPVTHAVSYAYQASGTSGTGSLVRTLDGNSNVVLDNLLAPTTSFPIFQQDPTVRNVVIISLSASAATRAPIRQIRRIAIKG